MPYILEMFFLSLVSFDRSESLEKSGKDVPSDGML